MTNHGRGLSDLAWRQVIWLALLPSCSSNPNAGALDEGGTGGIDPTGGAEAETGSLPAEGSDGDGNGDGDGGSGTSQGSDSGDPGTCPGEENACGGCSTLDHEVGESCNGCDGLQWTCTGPDAVHCEGADPDAQTWFPDEDEDGFGDADHEGLQTCEDPPEGWVPNGDDCDDANAEANPDGSEVCNGIDDDCNGAADEAPSDLCDDACCSFELTCDGQACVPKCDGGEICGENLDICCTGGETCFGGSCVTPNGACEFTEQCAVDEVCASALGQCVPDDVVPQCEFIPEPGDFEPVLGCRWTSEGLPNPEHDDVVATPIVVRLNDDDIPDIAFLTYDLDVRCCNTQATLRVVSGACNPDGTMNTLASITSHSLTNDTGLAAGDLDGDGVPELVTVGLENVNRAEGTIAFRRAAADGSSWEELWANDTYPDWGVHTRGGPIISIADLDANGMPEVIIGNVVLDGVDGTLVWDGVQTVPGGGIGNNGFLGPSSAVADIDLDGFMEVIAGNTVYEHDGTEKWTFDYVTSNSNCGGNLPCDGFNAVANFDDDDQGEVVIVRLGEVFVLDEDGTEIRRIVLPSGGCNFNESGPPTVADFDGDGRPEIGTASADYYAVVDLDCQGDPLPAECSDPGILWRVDNEDCSSRVTASSVFDFEGDGAAEVVYADEVSVRIFDGRTGAILESDDTFGSHTRIEMPVIADVDNDGNAEIVVGENRHNGRGNPGLDIFEDASDNWVRTRRVWNQHGYHITHINEDGTVPTTPEINWLNGRLNNYRQNVQPDGLFLAPDAAIESNQCVLEAQGDQSYEAIVSVLVRNDGAITVPAGTPVRIDGVDADTTVVLLETQTSVQLLPGQFEVLPLELSIPAELEVPFELRAIVDPTSPESPNGSMNECVEDNNEAGTVCALPQ